MRGGGGVTLDEAAEAEEDGHVCEGYGMCRKGNVRGGGWAIRRPGGGVEAVLFAPCRAVGLEDVPLDALFL